MQLSNKIFIWLIVLACFVSFFSSFGSKLNLIEPIFFNKFLISFNQIQFYDFKTTFILNNEWWRLISPMLIHFSPTHLIFNCLWIYILGKEIESFDGKLLFLILILTTSASSNYAQYAFSGPAIFGGLSGVVYGLLGFCFVQETFSRINKYSFPPAIYLFMFIWLFIGFTGFLDLLGFGKIANFAHLGGLISGIISGYLFQMYNGRKKYE
ncbi:MAG: rhomboid family intramembrane serine protease [Gammaproteobacteria bacterium]